MRAESMVPVRTVMLVRAAVPGQAARPFGWNRAAGCPSQPGETKASH